MIPGPRRDSEFVMPTPRIAFLRAIALLPQEDPRTVVRSYEIELVAWWGVADARAGMRTRERDRLHEPIGYLRPSDINVRPELAKR